MTSTPAQSADVRRTAKKVLSRGQALVLACLAVTLIVGLVVDTHQTIIGLIATAMIFWCVFVGFKLVLWIAAANYRFPKASRADPSDPNLPTYTVLVPLYQEGQMLKRLIEAVGGLEYPRDKLEVLLLVEADDEEIWSVLRTARLPDHFHIRIVEVPPGGPRTKPNALNFGLFHAVGELCVIYDAEDRPEPDQLLKAVAGFRSSPPEVACLQARLAFWNDSSSWITRFYWAEYVTHFEWVLTGLAKLNLVPPLGGTSNHFITARLREVAIDSRLLPFRDEYLGGWDPYNVTEDAELAAALAQRGYRVAMVDSTTWEEATAYLPHADKQRRRWLKGYAQTGLIYTRSPSRTIAQMGFKNWFFFILIMLGTPLSLLLNPFFWATTIVYFATRATVIEQLFPLPLYYCGLVLMVAGNLLLFLQLVAACLKREGYASVKYMTLAPFWWIATTWSAYAMLFELMFRPHHWHKTKHGHDLAKEELQFVGNAP